MKKDFRLSLKFDVYDPVSGFNTVKFGALHGTYDGDGDVVGALKYQFNKIAQQIWYDYVLNVHGKDALKNERTKK